MSEDKRYTVLAVDDQEGVLKTIDVMLRDSPFEVVMTTNPQEAIALATQQPIDVVLLDILMPETSGISLAVQMRSNPIFKDIPIVMLTAANDFSLLRRAQKVGANKILLKPIGKKHLLNKLLSVLNENHTAAAAV